MHKEIKKWGWLAFVFVASFILVVGCGQGEQNEDAVEENGSAQVETNEENNEENNEANNQDNEGQANERDANPFPITVVDDIGEEITIEEQPQAIVTLMPSITESAFALGLGDQIVGVSDHDTYPEEALEKEPLGGLEINTEAVLDIEPDVIFVPIDHHNNYEEILDQFREVGIHVIVVDSSATQLEEAYDNIHLIGEATGKNEEAAEMVDDLQERMSEIETVAAEEIDEPKRVWVEVGPAPEIFTTGSNTFMDEMLQVINAENAAQDVEGWVQFSEEEIVELEPEVIITTYGDLVEDPEQEVMNREGWDAVPAVQEEQVFDVNTDIVSRPGPRIVEGVETLAEHIYPEVFGD